MAKIRIEEKKSGSILPWILGLLLLLLIGWVAFSFLDDEDNDGDLLDKEEMNAPLAEMATELTGEEDGTYTDVDDSAYRMTVTKFMDYTVDMEGEMGIDHEFSHAAITYLADATDGIAGVYDVKTSDNTDRARKLADDITKDPYATNHADMIRMAALNITETLERIDSRAMNGKNEMALKNMRKEAQAISAETLTLNQKEDVRSFFRAARKVMAGL